MRPGEAPGAPWLVVGCGYTGAEVARTLVARGEPVVATARSDERRGAIEATGARFLRLELDVEADAEAAAAMEAPAAVIVTAPAGDEHPGARLDRLLAIARGAPLVVVVSTACYGEQDGEVTEATPLLPAGDRARRWALLDEEARARGARVVRAPAIYGPGRAFEADLRAGTSIVIDDGPVTSRIHVHDLARLLVRMADPDAPAVLLACDDEPAPTAVVVREAARLLGLPGPRAVTRAEAPGVFSPTGLEMRLSGRRCRSLERPRLGVASSFPTYREGLAASLAGRAGSGSAAQLDEKRAPRA